MSEDSKAIANHLVRSSIEMTKRAKFKKTQKELTKEFEKRMPDKKNKIGRPKKKVEEQSMEIRRQRGRLKKSAKILETDDENEKVILKVGSLLGLDNMSPDQRESHIRFCYDNHMNSTKSNIDEEQKMMFYAKQIDKLNVIEPIMYSDTISEDFKEFQNRRKQTGIDLSLDLFGKEVDKWPMM